jgi:hypothetical protein
MHSQVPGIDCIQVPLRGVVEDVFSDAVQDHPVSDDAIVKPRLPSEGRMTIRATPSGDRGFV